MALIGNETALQTGDLSGRLTGVVLGIEKARESELTGFIVEYQPVESSAITGLIVEFSAPLQLPQIIRRNYFK